MSFCTLLLVFFINTSDSQTTTNTKCQYVSLNWDDLRNQNDTQTFLRKYVDADGGSAYLPPFPKLFDHYNESFANIPYPTQQCLRVDNIDTSFTSYMFVCVEGKPTLKTWQDSECAGDEVTESLTSLLDDTTLDITYVCDGSSPSCQFIAIQEEYYIYNDASNNECNEEDKLLYTYTGKYAVDVCLSTDGSSSSFKYICDTRTLTYTRVQYSDPDCTDILDSKQASEIECVDNFIINIINEVNLTNPDDDIVESIEYAKSTFVSCTSIDDFELSYEDYCVSSQVSIMDNEGFQDNTAVPQFGPFGMEPVSKKQLVMIDMNQCDLCDILNNGGCRNESVNWDESILLIDQLQTENITQCIGGTKQFVRDVQSLSNVTVYGIIFTSNSNISLYGDDSEDIIIPTRIMNPTVTNNKYKNILESALSCNYRDGYPSEICISVTCTPFADQCDNIIFAGTYIIQNMSFSDKVYNSNPTWEKSAIGEIDEQYIWLDVIVISDGSLAGVSPYVELQWVVSSIKGDSSNGLYCTIKDVNIDSDNKDSNNFDVIDCEWKSIELRESITNTSNQTSINVATAPFKCFDNTNTVPIASVCVDTYQIFDISTCIGTYYEIASGSAIYIQDINTSTTELGILKRGKKLECEYEDDHDFYGYYTLPIDDDTIPSECEIKNEEIELFEGTSEESIAKTNMSWILYRMEYDAINEINYYKIMAYCNIKASDTSSVVSCHKWFVYNDSTQAYFRDNSFDVDNNECEQSILSEYEEYADILCFQLMRNETAETKTEIIYSQVQYLWGQYTKLNNTLLFNRRPIYQNTRLQNTQFDTYLIFYDPKDAWVFVTKSNFLSMAMLTQPVLKDFDGFANLFQDENDQVIVTFCDNNNEEEDEFPQDCLYGWTINYEWYNLSDIALLISDETCTGLPNYLSNNTQTFSKNDKIKDLCASFYQREEDCIIPGEKWNQLNTKPDECVTPQYFETSDWCNNSNTDMDECPLLDGNGIYSINSDKSISNRSYWIHEEETIFFYVYYHKYLRFWMWGTDNGNSSEKLDSFEELKWLEINAFCLKWDVNVDQCTEFFYRNDENVQKNASSIVDDCTIVRDDSIILVQEISGWIIVSCFSVGFCVFCIGFYKEYMEKRNKKKGARVSVLPAGDLNETHIGMVTHLDATAPTTITEEKTSDIDEEEDGNDTDKLNASKPSSTDNV